MSGTAVEPSPSAPSTDAPIARGGLRGYADQWIDNVKGGFLLQDDPLR